MKKLIAVITTAVILAGGLASVAMAQTEKLNECCVIQNSFNLTIDVDGNPTDGVFTKGIVVGGTSGICSFGGPDVVTKDWGMVCMLNTIYTVTNWIFYIMTLVAVLMIVFGGFTYITAAGDPAKAGKGKSILTYAIIGLAIALVAKLIPSLVRFILGV